MKALLRLSGASLITISGFICCGKLYSLPHCWNGGELVFEPENADQLIDAEERRPGMIYETLQRTATRAALCENIMILTGGPGTGKTTTLNGMIDILEEQQKTSFLPRQPAVQPSECPM